MSKIQRIKCGPGNCYIVSDENNAILVDTGSTEHIHNVLEECKQYNMKLIVLTHPHWDHAENAKQLSKEWGCQVAMGQEDYELFADYKKQILYANTLVGKISLRISIPSLEKRIVQEISNPLFVEDGFDLSQFGVNASIVSLPGHTNGHIGVDVKEAGLIVGDAMSNWIIPSPAPLFHNKEVMLKSVEKIQNFGEVTLFFGHGKPAKNKRWI